MENLFLVGRICMLFILLLHKRHSHRWTNQDAINLSHGLSWSTFRPCISLDNLVGLDVGGFLFLASFCVSDLC